MRQKILSILLVMTMLFSALPISAFAEIAGGEMGSEHEHSASINETEQMPTPTATAEAAEEPTPTATAEATEEPTPTATAEATEEPSDDAAAAVQEMIDQLPTIDTVTADDYDNLQNVYDAYCDLTDEQQAQIAGADIFEVLFNWFNGQIMTLGTGCTHADSDNDAVCDTCTEELVAVANGVYYTSFNDACNANQNSSYETIKLLRDAKYVAASTDTFKFGNVMAYDLNGHKLTIYNSETDLQPGSAEIHKSCTFKDTSDGEKGEIVTNDVGITIKGDPSKSISVLVNYGVKLKKVTVIADEANCDDVCLRVLDAQIEELDIQRGQPLLHGGKFKKITTSVSGKKIVDYLDDKVKNYAFFDEDDNVIDAGVTELTSTEWMRIGVHVHTAVNDTDCCACGVTAVARVDDTYYFSFADAYNAVKTQSGKTIKLLKNTNVHSIDKSTSSPKYNSTFTLDLNGNTANLETVSSLIKCLTLQGGCLTVTDSSGSSVKGKSDFDEIECNGGSLTLENGVNIKKISVSSDSSVVTVKDAQINELNITQGTAKLSGGKFKKITTSAGGKHLSDYLAENHYYCNENGDEIDAETLTELTATGDDWIYVKAHIHDFTNGPTCACGVSAVATIDDTYYYISFNEAYTAMANNIGDTIKLLADAQYNKNGSEAALGLGGNRQLDLNGHNLTVYNTTDNTTGSLKTTRTFTYTDTSNGEKGSIITNDNGIRISYFSYEPQPSVKFKNGIKISKVTVDNSGATVSIEDAQINELNITQGTVKLSGGKFKKITTSADGKHITDYLDKGYAFFDKDDNVINAVGKTELTDENGDWIYVKAHTHDFTNGLTCACGASAVAMVDDVYYTSFNDAYDAVKTQSGKTIKLLKSTSYVNTVSTDNPEINGGTFTVDLNGFSLGAKEMNGSPRILKIKNAEITVTDNSQGTAKGRLDIGNDSNSSYYVDLGENAKLTLKGGVEAYKILSTSTLTIEDAAVENIDFYGGTIQLYGGKFKKVFSLSGNISQILAKGYLFYDADNIRITVNDEDDSLEKADGGWIYVKAHTPHTLGADGKCECGADIVASVTTADETPVVTYYIDVPAALAAAKASTGSTLKFLKNYRGDIKADSGNFKLDATGYTIDESEIEVKNGATLTILGGTFKKRVGCASVVNRGGKLNITGGMFYGNIAESYSDSTSSTNISGGTVNKGQTAEIRRGNISGGKISTLICYSENVKITGGEFRKISATATQLSRNLGDGYIFKYNDVWNTGDTQELGTSLTSTDDYAVKVVKKPIQSYNAALSNSNPTYNSGDITLTISDIVVADGYSENNIAYSYSIDNGTAVDATNPYSFNVGTVGDHAVSFTMTLDGYAVNGTKNYTVKKADSTVTAPTGIANLKYTGGEQLLVENGSAFGGEMQYSLEKDGTYSSTIPTGTDAKEYTVWYKVVGNDNYNGIDAQSITVSIAKADSTVTAPTGIANLKYTGDEQALVENGSADGGELQYSLEKDGTYSSTIPTGTDAKEYTVWYKVVGNDNYNGIDAQSITVSIAKADSTLTAPTGIANLKYTGDEQALVENGSAVGGEMQYSLEKDGTYSSTIPTGVDAKEYTVWYKVVGDSNHNDSTAESVEVTIGKADISAKVKNGSKTYGDEYTDYGIEVVSYGDIPAEMHEDILTQLKSFVTYSSDGAVKTASVKEGGYSINAELSQSETDNFKFTVKSGTLTVNKAPLKIKAKNVSREYGAANPQTTAEYYGFKNDETEAVLTGETVFTYDDSINEKTPVGEYAGKISVSGITSENYDITFESGDVTITKMKIKVIIEVSNSNKIVIRFSNPIDGMTVTHFVVKKDGTIIPLKGVKSSSDNQQYTLSGNFAANEPHSININLDGIPADDIYEIENNNVSTTPQAVSYGGGGGGSGIVDYLVAFETNGGSKIEGTRVDKNKTLTQPEDPTKDGYEFAGWYSDKELAQKYDFTAKVTKNITLYASWTEKTTQPNDDDNSNNSSNPSNPSDDKWTNPFSDVDDDDWFRENVEYVEKNKLMNGTSDTTFGPKTAVTRAMLVTVLWRADGRPQTEHQIKFDDVKKDAYYFDAIRWAAGEGIVNGITDERFAPEAHITREQIATIIYRYAKYKGTAPSGAWAIRLDYADLAQISDYALEAVMYCKLKGIMQGKENNNFAPKDSLTRAEMAAILQRYLELDK